MTRKMLFYFSLVAVVVLLLAGEVLYEAFELQTVLEPPGRIILEKFVTKFAVMLVVVLIVVYIIFNLYTARLRRSIEHVTQKTQQLAEGDFKAELDPRSRDEVSKLAAQISSLGGQHKAIRKQLKSVEKRLEKAEEQASRSSA